MLATLDVTSAEKNGSEVSSKILILYDKPLLRLGYVQKLGQSKGRTKNVSKKLSKHPLKTIEF